jgi:predicted Zn-dependent protease
MSRRKPLSRLLILVLASTIFPAVAQNTSKGCPAPPAILASTQPNIFSEQQEQWLGDAMADQIERRYKIVQDPAQNEYLAHIAKRLLAALPPTTIQFRVVLVDSPSINAFSLAGGRIYVFRKLVANARNEDEVASVIGHEMGHILSHQFAIRTTADLKRLLGVTSVGDKADIYAKFQRLIDASMKDKHPSQSGNSDEKQDEADTVSMYAIAAAGYRPQAFSEFWETFTWAARCASQHSSTTVRNSQC